MQISIFVDASAVLLTNRNYIINILAANQPIEIDKTTKCIETCRENVLHICIYECFGGPFGIASDAKNARSPIFLLFDHFGDPS